MSNPIEHVVVIVKENHTFDNYFGAFPGAAGVALPPAPDPMVADPPHDHAAWLATQSKNGGLRQQYGANDIPAYWAYAQTYALCDNYFTDVASQSEPNHLHLIAADSPVIDNASPNRRYQPSPPYALANLPATLEAAGQQWRSYAAPNASYFDHIAALAGHRWNVAWTQFDQDATAGTLPDVAWLYAPGEFSEHPGDRQHTGRPIVRPGMQWTADRVQAVAGGPRWPQTAIFITWDDWGGWYDHVQPVLAARWAKGGPAGYANSQFRYGPRVPCLVVSPFARRAVVHAFYSHSSIVKFCLRLFGLAPWGAPSLRPGDASGDMWECFDFAAAPRLAPPPARV
jgi:phospholipase C